MEMKYSWERKKAEKMFEKEEEKMNETWTMERKRSQNKKEKCEIKEI